MTIQPGQMLHNRYQIQSQLGQGGMGAVYLARDMSLEHKVAVKEMRPAADLSPQALEGLRQQFQREARVLAGLAHPNLPRVIDCFSEGGNEYLVMDYVEGKPLDEILKTQGKPGLPEAQVLDWGRQLLDALEYIHSKSVLHRDIKPANIRLTPEGRVLLVDFGLVKLYDPRSPQTVLVLRGAGTPQYAPPEQIDSNYGHTDARSDIFALGATLYYLLTGHLPPSITERLIKQSPIPPIWSQASGVSSAFEAAIFKAMQLRPDDRFQSAAEMRAALPQAGAPPTQRFTESRPPTAPTQAPPVQPPRQVSQPISRPAPAQVTPTPPPPMVAPNARATARAGGIPTWAWLGGCGCLLALAACVALTIFFGLIPSSTSTPTPVAAITVTPVPQPDALYADDFSDPSSGWDVNDGDNSTVGYTGSGKYFIAIKTDGYASWANPKKLFSDVSIEVNASVVSGDQDTEYGIICRYQDGSNFYVLQVAADGTAAIRKKENGEQFKVISGNGEWTSSDAINQGVADNTLKAVCSGNTLTLYVNGTQVAEATDDSFSSGDVGLFAGTFGVAGARVEFSDFVVRNP